MSLTSFRNKARWLSLITGIIFLAIHFYMRHKFIFESGNAAARLLLISMIASLLTFVLGLFALPRWQAFIALAISVYAGYWFAYGPLYAIS
jgi:hypothetical protein